MKVDKILTIVVSIVILVFLAIQLYPSVVGTTASIEEDMEDVKGNYYGNIITNYLNSKPDYYFKIEGAIYCIPVRTLIDEGKIKESNVPGHIDSIIEAEYIGGKYVYEYNDDCIEK